MDIKINEYTTVYFPHGESPFVVWDLDIILSTGIPIPNASAMTLEEIQEYFDGFADRDVNCRVISKLLTELSTHRKAFYTSEEAYGPVRKLMGGY